MSALTHVVAISAGSNYSLALRSDGRVWAWGGNTWGQLGDGTNTARAIPVEVTPLQGVVAIAAGEDGHALALKSDGTVWTWGKNAYGQLGDGTNTSRAVPVQVSALAGIVAIAAGSNHSLALRSDGTVWAWGANGGGRLGDGSQTDRKTPVKVSSVSGVIAIAAGYEQSFALVSNGSVWAWGDNGYGQLGDGTSTSSPTPVKAAFDGVAPLLSGVSISGIGQVGATLTGTSSDAGTGYWVVVPAGAPVPGAAEIVAGTGASGVAPAASGSAPINANVAAGLAIYGLAPGTAYVAHLAVDDGRTNRSAVSSVAFATLTGDVTPDAFAFADRTGMPRLALVESQPVVVSGITGTVVASVTGGEYAVSSNGGATYGAWTRQSPATLRSGDRVKLRVVSSSGYSATANATLTLGSLSDTFSVATLAAATNLAAQKSVAAGSGFSLGLGIDGSVWTWGIGYSGQLGDGTIGLREKPGQVSSLSNIVAIAAGSSHALALRRDGTVWAWGDNYGGQLGDGTTTQRPTPLQVSPLANVVAIAAGSGHSLAVTRDGSVWAWGRNDYGQLGDGTTTRRTTPVQVPSLSGVVAIATSASAYSGHTLALKGDGTLWAWGTNGNGQLGDGTTTPRLAPVQITSLSGVVAVAAGASDSSDHSLALRSDGTVWAWGGNSYGQLGDGTTTARSTPLRVSSLSGIVGVAAGAGASFALGGDGALSAWGANTVGQLGDGTSTQRLAPVQVTSLSGVVAVAAGDAHVLALTGDGAAWAWGSDNYGQLGDGTTTYTPRPAPVRVVAPTTGYFNLSPIAALYFPLADGSSWSYTRDGVAGYTRGVPGAEPFGTAQTTKVYLDSPEGSKNYMTSDVRGVLLYGAFFPSSFVDGCGSTTETDIFSPPILIAPPDFSPGQSVNSSGSVMSMLSCGTVSLSYTSLSIAFGFENVVVPAGVFNAAKLAVNRTVTFMGISSTDNSVYWLARGIGVVQQLQTVDGVTETWALTGTNLARTDPDSFSFTPQSGVQKGAAVQSNSVTVSGITAQAPISIIGGTYSVNGAAHTAAPGMVVNGQSLAVRVTAGSSYGAVTSALLTIGGVSAPFSVSTSTDTLTPSVPSGLAAAVASSSRIDLSWSAASDNDTVAQYRVYRNGMMIATPAGASYFDTGLNAFSAYTYAVQACDPSGNCSAQSASVQATTQPAPDMQAPTVPAGLTASAAGPIRINLSWAAAGDNVAVTQYRVFRNGVQVATVAGTVYADTGVVPANTYAYSVSACDAAGNCSAQSDQTSGQTPPDTQAPTQPVGLQARALTASHITLSWTAAGDDVGVAHYKVYRDTDSYATPIATLPGSTLAFGDASVSASTAYSYRVAACDAAANCSAQSAIASATTLAPGMASVAPSYAPGFNLGSNPLSGALDVSALFGNQDPGKQVPGVSERIDAVWAWNAQTQKWRFYSPQLTSAQNAAYAAANHFEVLTTVPAGEGYWTNAYQPLDLPEQSGAAFNYDGDSFGSRPQYWNLLAIGAAGMTPAQFTAAVGTFESLWMWDPERRNWYFYAPELDQPGSTFTSCNYALQNNLLDFAGCTPNTPSRTLGLGAGFWVYRP